MDRNFRESLEPGELLEEYWFFGNLLDSRSKTMRSCFSLNQENVCEKSYEETYESIKKLERGSKEFSGHNLSRGTSMPVSCSTGKKKLKKKSSINSLVRAPSLPTSLFGNQEFDEDDDEIEFSMGRLIRTASLNDSETTSPKMKGIARSSRKSMDQSRMNPNIETIKLSNQFDPLKSFKDLESEELQGFKDLGFEFNDKDMNPNVINIIPDLQENERIEEEAEKNARKTMPYLSEVWHTESSSSHVPNRANEEDMKEQIKFWAKSVASNVR